MVQNKNIIAWVVAAVLALSLGIGFLNYQSSHPSTDDAYVNAHIINISAQVTGPVANIYVQNNQQVTKGQVLFTIDPRPFQYAVSRAQASLADAQAALKVAQNNVPRILTLVNTGRESLASGTTAQGQLDKANADVQFAQANLAQAQLNLSYTSIVAPASGTLINFNLQNGDMVNADQQVFALVDNQQWWIDANFKETDLKRIRPGELANIKIDIYPGVTFKGYVDSISIGSGAAFALLPPEDATGNWVKVTQRFPVKVVIVEPNPNYPLRVGASSDVTINTNSHS